MPYKSDAQRRYFHANQDELERQGVNVSEWDRASKGKAIPERVEKSADIPEQVRNEVLHKCRFKTLPG